MNNEEISRYIHVEIMGKCVNPTVWVWEPGSPYETTMVGACPVCSKAHNNPDYCSDDSPRRLLNEVVAKIESTEDLICFLVQITGWHAYELRATAEQIATACVEAHKLTAKPAA